MKSGLERFAGGLLEDIRQGAAGRAFEQAALELFQLQFEGNAPYRRLCMAGSVTPDSVTDWKSIPAVPTAAFQELELTSLPTGKRQRTFYSSGTTGQRPSRHHHSTASLALYDEAARAWFAPHALPDAPSRNAGGSLLWISLTPPPDQVPHSSLVHMIDRLGTAFAQAGLLYAGTVEADASWRLRWDVLLPLLEQASSAGQPVFVLGTAFNHVHMLDHLRSVGSRLRLARGSRVFETGGYKGRSRQMDRTELYAALTDALDIPGPWILSEYGMSELSSQAYDVVLGRVASGDVGQANPGSRRFRFPPWARVAVISPETGREVPEGEVGLLRVWDLANVWSVLALQTGDLARREGDGFCLLGRRTTVEPRGCSLMSP